MAKAKKTRPKGKTSKKAQRRRGRILPKLTSSQEAGLTVLHTDLARTVASTFSTFWMSVVDTDFKSLQVTTFGAYRDQLEDPGFHYVCSVAPLKGKAVLSYSGVTYAAVDRRMGGHGSPLTGSRHPTEIERKVLSSLAVNHLSDIEAAWDHVIRLRIDEAELETNPTCLRIASPGEAVLQVNFEVHAQHAAGYLQLCYPFEMLTPVLPVLGAETDQVIESRRAKLPVLSEEESIVLEEPEEGPVLLAVDRVEIAESDPIERTAYQYPKHVGGLLTSWVDEDRDGEPTGAQKAAILVGALGDAANRVLQVSPSRTKNRIASALDTLKTVTMRQQRDVVEEAVTRMAGGDYLLLDALSEARSHLSGPKSGGFRLLNNVEASALIPVLAKELPQTIALVLTQLDSTKAAEVIDGLSPKLQADVSYRIATMDHLKPDSFRVLEETLSEEVRSWTGVVTEIGGPKCLADILNRTGRSTEKNVLERIDKQDSDCGVDIRNLMFVYDDIANLTDREIQLVLKEVDQKDLAVGLKGASDAFKKRVFANVSEATGEKLREEMQFSGPVRMSDVEKVQLAAVKIVRQLEEAGKVTVIRGDSKDKFV